MKTQVKINNYDVSSYLVRWLSTEDQNQDLNKVIAQFSPAIHNALSFDNGASISIKRGRTLGTENTIFNGYIENIDKLNTITVCKCNDRLFDLWRTQVTQTYLSSGTQAGKISAIFSDLVTTYGGLRADSTTITDSGSVFTLERFRCIRNKVIDKCKQLRDVLDWEFHFNADEGKVYFGPRGDNIYATNLVVGSNISNSPKWTRDLSQCVNKITVTGESQEVETEQLFSGDGSTTAFTLSFRPSNVRVEHPVDTLLTGGVSGGSGSYDYTVDAENGIINFEAAPASDTNNIKVTYTYLLPIVVEDLDQDSIDAYKTYEKTITRFDIKTVNDAIEYAGKYLSKYAQPFLGATLRLRPDISDEFGLGYRVHVIDTANNIDNDVIVIRIIKRYPETFDDITVGDKEWRMGKHLSTVQYRLEELERKDIKTPEVQTLMRRASDSVDFEDRYLKIQTETVAGTDIFILNHSDYGILGIGKLGDADLGTAATQRIVQGKDTYKEYFYDTDFKDATYTTATWNITSKKAELDYKEVVQTSDIYANNASVGTVKLNISQGSGSKTVKINTQLPALSGVDIIEEI